MYIARADALTRNTGRLASVGADRASDAPPRLRQAVLVAHDLAATVEQLRGELGLGEPFADPGVGLFGLSNAVFAVGDTFLEVVSPVAEGTAAGRHLERRGGDGGYMVMFQVADLAGPRARAKSLEIREIWGIELDDIAAVHLHPSDMAGAIVSLDQPSPPESWRWAGPDWRARSAPGGVVGATLAVADPPGVAARWEAVLGAPPSDAGVSFVEGDAGLVEVTLAGRGEDTELGGVRFRRIEP